MRFYIYIIAGVFIISGCAAPARYTRHTVPSTYIPENISSKAFIWPVKGKVVSSFGDVNSDRINKGVDIKTEVKQEVKASSDGQVVFCGDVRGFGLTIILKHSDDIYTLYSNNFKSFVKPKQVVKKGQVISLVGIDPWTRESILHFEVRKNNNPVNPLYVLD